MNVVLVVLILVCGAMMIYLDQRSMQRKDKDAAERALKHRQYIALITAEITRVDSCFDLSEMD